MIQATVRRDGSSRFGSENKWAIFPSVSLGWNVTNEGFLDGRPDWFDYLKIRASWGQNGNQSIGNFAYTSLMMVIRTIILVPVTTLLCSMVPVLLVSLIPI